MFFDASTSLSSSARCVSLEIFQFVMLFNSTKYNNICFYLFPFFFFLCFLFANYSHVIFRGFNSRFSNSEKLDLFFSSSAAAAVSFYCTLRVEIRIKYVTLTHSNVTELQTNTTDTTLYYFGDRVTNSVPTTNIPGASHESNWMRFPSQCDYLPPN